MVIWLWTLIGTSGMRDAMAAARPLLEDDPAEAEPPEEKDEPREAVERAEVDIANR
jgi:hypothetical protein